MIKLQKDINKLSVSDKRSSASKKRSNNNNSHNATSYISGNTPEKSSNNIKSIMNALNLSMTSVQSANRK